MPYGTVIKWNGEKGCGIIMGRKAGGEFDSKLIHVRKWMLIDSEYLIEGDRVEYELVWSNTLGTHSCSYCYLMDPEAEEAAHMSDCSDGGS